MKLEGDKIRFEYRSEVDEISVALGKYADEHPDESNTESVRKLEKLLDTMYFGW